MIKGPHALCLAIVLGMPTVGTLAAQPDSITSSGRVEVVMANEHRKDLEEIRKEFAEAGLTNLHVRRSWQGRRK
ncbi:MAG TPA: hypothetical protein VN039_13515 [Nitrospira sp.]|nr:hypothetical protein [Nitrospira sp.]